jgi:putative addiction module CopG family antidote
MAVNAAGRNISLTEIQTRFLDDQVASGRHASASEVVREALRRYAEDVEYERAALKALQAIAAQGDADYAAGRFNSYETAEAHQGSMDNLIADVRKRHKTREASV